jgi:hypothetical protein
MRGCFTKYNWNDQDKVGMSRISIMHGRGRKGRGEKHLQSIDRKGLSNETFRKTKM